jgi:outer membrane receptor protein involved in Fe transport
MLLCAWLVMPAASVARDEPKEDAAMAEEAAVEKPSDDQVWYDTVTVTAARTEVNRVDVPANVSVLGREEVRESAAITIDGVLRAVPGFATLRQQSSIVSSVQSQSVSMRGLGGTTTSRTLVLFDGIPINDPYGGWIYWAKAPRELIDRVEVVRGGGASIWGNLSLGGVINMMSIEPSGRSLDVSVLQGDHHTNDFNVAVADAGTKWSGWASGDYFDTEGYHVVREDLRGPVDEPTSKQNESYLGKVSFAPSPSVSLRLTGDYWEESRRRGSPLDRVSAEAWSVVANGGVATRSGSLDTHVFFRHQDWLSNTARQSLDRTTEAPSSRIFDQPSDVLAGSATWSSQRGERHRLLLGVDLQEIDIEHHQDLNFRNGRFLERQDVEGSQQLAGVFVQDMFDPGPRWSIQAGARFDQIKNHDGQVVNVDAVTGNVVSVIEYSDHDESTLNPSLGAVYRATDAVSLRGSAYTGFRAPTTGELYKGFRAGSATTEPNPDLDAETLQGAEIGADYRSSRRFFGRVTGFWNELEDLILQTTVGVAGPAGAIIPPCGAIPPRGVCRQRNNVGQVEARGLELEGEYRAGDRWSFFLSSMIGETEIEEAPELPDLVGKRLPQSAEESVTLQIRWSDPKIVDATIQGRYVGERFEDDVNTLPLDSLEVVDVVLSRGFAHGISVFLGVENLFDQEYEVLRDTSGLVLVERRTSHIGVRYALR